MREPSSLLLTTADWTYDLPLQHPYARCTERGDRLCLLRGWDRRSCLARSPSLARQASCGRGLERHEGCCNLDRSRTGVVPRFSGTRTGQPPFVQSRVLPTGRLTSSLDPPAAPPDPTRDHAAWLRPPCYQKPAAETDAASRQGCPPSFDGSGQSRCLSAGASCGDQALSINGIKSELRHDGRQRPSRPGPQQCPECPLADAPRRRRRPYPMPCPGWITFHHQGSGCPAED